MIRRVRPRSAAGRTAISTTNDGGNTPSNSMQILPPEPPRPVSATPVLQPIPSNKLSEIDRIRRPAQQQQRQQQQQQQHQHQHQLHQQQYQQTQQMQHQNTTNIMRSKNNSTTKTSEQETFAQEQKSRVFLTDVRSISRSDTVTPSEDGRSYSATSLESSTSFTSTNTRETSQTAASIDKNGDLEDRIVQVQETQDQMRQELEKYLEDVRSRTGDDGTVLVEFPETFDADSQSETNREASWRKFISDRVMSHPNEEFDRETKKKL
jgi:hypothetical protein